MDRWRKWTGPLEDHQILRVIEGDRGGILRGCFWDEQTLFAVLDIDSKSQYHTQEKLTALLTAVENIGLRVNLYQSSVSGGWHLYIPLAGWQNSSEVEHTFKRWLKSLGYEIKGGQLEVFPSGNALRLPLQPGFAWLDFQGNLIRTREELKLNQALLYFLEDLEENAQDWQSAKMLMDSQILSVDRAGAGDAQEQQKRLEMNGFDDFFSGGKIKELWERGQKFWQEGLEKPGERNDAVLSIGHYLWYGDDDNDIDALPGARHDEYRALLIEEWLKAKHNGYCRHVNEDQWQELRGHIRRATGWRSSKKFDEKIPYLLTDRLLKRLVAHYKATGKVWTVADYEKANNDRLSDARSRIKTAILSLTNTGQLITVSSVHRESGASRTTVRKHRDLLASWIGDYIRGGTGGLGVVCSSEVEQEQLSEIELFSGTGCVLDSLRSDRTGQTAINSRQVTTEVLAAVHPIQSNYGVKHELTRSAPYVAPGGIACGINGTTPKGDPSIYSSAFFSIGAPAPNLRQVGNLPDGLTYKQARLNYSTCWLNVFAHAQQLDKAKTQVLPMERAFGNVPLSCYDKRRQRAGGRLLGSNGYIACRSGGKAMGNEANEKHEQLNRPPERQTDYEKRAQGEVNENVSDYTEKVMATRLEKKLSGNSGVTGQLPDKNGKGLASAKDLLGDDAHGLSKKEKNAALLAQVEKDGYIVGKPKLEQSATPDYQVAQNFDFGKQIQEKMQDAERTVWPHRGHEDRYLDYQACKQAFTQAHLDKFPGVTPELIAGAMRNEQSFYKNTDAAQDKQVREKGTVLNANGQEDDTASIGPAQMQIRKIRGLVNMETSDHKPKYPFLSTLKDDPVTKALEPKNAALLTAAYFAESAEALTKMKIPINNETLAYTWNPDVFKADGKYECPNAVQLKAEHQLPKQLRPHRESVWNPYNEDILKASTHVHNVNEQVRIIRERHLMGN